MAEFMSRKRKDPAISTIQETQGLFGVSNESRRLIFNASARALNQPDAQVKDRLWKNLVSEQCPQVFEKVEVEGTDSLIPVVFYVASIRKVLQHILATCPNFATLVEKRLQVRPADAFQIIIYNDEATGGNILQPNTPKKCSLWYFSCVETGFYWSDTMWHPLSVVQHSDFDKAKGGFSAIAKTIVRRILSDELETGFPVTLPSGPTLLRCQCKWMLSDLDSIRAVLNLKGSAAMRCCHFCRNCVKKHAGLEAYDNYFVDITSADISKFDIQTDQDIFQLWDHLLLEKGRLRKSAFQKKELAAGLNVHENAWLSDSLVRECITPWAFLLDAMHLYWSNGIVSWEVNAAHDSWSKTNFGNLSEFLSLKWKTQQVDSNTARWRVNLAHKTMFEGIAYKGSASNLQCFWPLFLYFLDQCVGPHGQLTEELKSLKALRRITIELRKIVRERCPNIQKLEALQVEHQDLCQKAFGYDFMKPKHHARHHLPKQIQLLAFAMDAFPCERKHKFYKSHIGLHRFDTVAQNRNGQFSHMVLKEVMIHHVESLQKKTILKTNFLGQRCEMPA